MDCVFEKEYSLTGLDKVEEFIKKNGHLPEIPSTKEVNDSNGINLGRMSELQLKKIEELTLYIIEMNKQLNSLVNKINVQEKEIEILEFIPNKILRTYS